MKKIASTLMICASLSLTTSCSTPKKPPQVVNAATENNDPIEGFNRYMFAVNDYLDMMVLRPVSYTYKTVTPKTFQDRIHDFLTNLRMPLTIVNYLLQGNTEKASKSFGRFLTNSTVGLFGFIDVAKDVGNPYDPTDFGVTFAKWGGSEGPYIVWPILGPSNARDTFGMIATAFTDPVNIYAYADDKEWITYARLGADAIDFRSRNMDTIDDIKKNSVDYYAKVRSLYRQKRKSLINDDDRYDDVDFPEYSELPTMEDLDR